MREQLWGVLLWACVVSLTAACGDGNDNGNRIPGGVFEPTGEDQVGREVLVSAVEFAFFPDTIVAVPGERLTIVFRNEGMDTHNIAFDLPDGVVELDENVPPGAEGALTFTVPFVANDYEFNCPISNHRSLGMVGTLVVQ